MFSPSSIVVGLLSLFCAVQAQLSGSVGPLTSVSSKKSKAICNVLDYGAVANNSTDLGGPLTDAFNACIDGMYSPTWSSTSFGVDISPRIRPETGLYSKIFNVERRASGWPPRRYHFFGSQLIYVVPFRRPGLCTLRRLCA